MKSYQKHLQQIKILSTFGIAEQDFVRLLNSKKNDESRLFTRPFGAGSRRF